MRLTPPSIRSSARRPPEAPSERGVRTKYPPRLAKTPTPGLAELAVPCAWRIPSTSKNLVVHKRPGARRDEPASGTKAFQLSGYSTRGGVGVFRRQIFILGYRPVGRRFRGVHHAKFDVCARSTGGSASCLPDRRTVIPVRWRPPCRRTAGRCRTLSPPVLVNVPGTRASRNLLANPEPVASRRPKLLNVVGVQRCR
jgi:hypothetical protein